MEGHATWPRGVWSGAYHGHEEAIGEEYLPRVTMGTRHVSPREVGWGGLVRG